MKKKVAVFDIDGTIFRNSLLIELHWKMVKEGIIPRTTITKIDKLYWQWVRRKGSYDDYLWSVIENFDTHIAGVPVKTVAKLARRVVKTQSDIVYRYTRDLVKRLSKTHILVAISGSPEIIVKEFARTWKFDYFIGTLHATERGYFTGEKKWVASEDKAAALAFLEQRHGFKVGKGSVGVGDTESDIKIFELVENPICFNPTGDLYKTAARKGWHIVVERKDTVFEIKKGKVLQSHGEE